MTKQLPQLPARYRPLECDRGCTKRIWWLITHHLADYVFFDRWFELLSRPDYAVEKEAEIRFWLEVYNFGSIASATNVFREICRFIKTGSYKRQYWHPGWTDAKLKRLIEEGI